MALLFLDGFDKFGPANSNSTSVAALLTAGEWTSTAGSSTFAIVAPLSATGQALQILGTNGANNIVKTLPASYSRLIGGLRFTSDIGGSGPMGFSFTDSGSNQCTISLAQTTGILTFRNANHAGTVLATSGVSIAANTTHYLEWDIAFGNTAAYQIWLDGVSVMSGTGDTTATANNTANGFVVTSGSNGNQTFKIDDFYLFDTTGTANNAPLLTSPRIETSFPSGDSAVQFAVGAGILGSSIARDAGGHNTSANQFRVRAFTPSVNMTLNSITLMPSSTNAAIQLRPIVYSDSAGAAGALLSAGATVVGLVSGVAKTMPLTTPQALTAGTQYWLGFMCDISAVGLANLEIATNDRIGTSTFASGAPGTAPSTATASTSTLMWGNVSGTGVNWYEAAQNPTQGNLSYVYDATVGHEDLYAFPNLATTPATVHAVAIKANVARSDSGAKTVSMRMKSGATDGGGSATGQTPGTSYGWLTSLFATDPNTGAAWLPTNLNAAQIGFKIDS